MRQDRDKLLRRAAATAACLAACLAGCAEGGRITGGEARLMSDDGSPAFLDRIASQTAVSENDALRGLLLMLEGKDDAPDFRTRVHRLRARGVLNADWDFQADRPLARGRLAYMIYQAARVPGGVILAVAGPSERYCLRELQYRGFMTSAGSVFGQVTGSEYVAVLSRADEYLRTGKLPTVMTAPGQE